MRGTGDSAGRLIPVAETEFAKDASFGYTSSEMADYVEEKSRGRFPRTPSSPSTSAPSVRARPWLAEPHRLCGAIADAIDGAVDSTPIVADVVTENDLRALALGLEESERRGKKLLYRVGPPFVRARIGQEIPARSSPAQRPTPALAFRGRRSDRRRLARGADHPPAQGPARAAQRGARRRDRRRTAPVAGDDVARFLEQVVATVVEGLRSGDVISAHEPAISGRRPH